MACGLGSIPSVDCWRSGVIRRTALDAAPARQQRLEVGPHLGLPLPVLGRCGGAGLAWIGLGLRLGLGARLARVRVRVRVRDRVRVRVRVSRAWVRVGVGVEVRVGVRWAPEHLRAAEHVVLV